MSTSSGNKTPKLTSEASKQVISTDWNEFAALVEESARDEFSQWLDEQLGELEKDLEKFVTARSRYSGRR